MKKYAYIICIFFIVVFFTAMYYTESKQNISDVKYIEEENIIESNATTNSDDFISSKPATNDEDVTAINYDELSFIIKSVDGIIVIYYEDGQTVFLDTGIAVDSLGEINFQIPEDGIYIKNAKELFDLLETYSS